MASSAASTAVPNSSGSVSFKAYLVQKGSDKPVEVRRFGVEQNEVTSFDLLKKKLRLVFPHLSGQDFTMGWKDFENDEIIISSNEELLTFLTETTDQVRRLYLTIKNPVSICIQPTFEWKPIDVVLGNTTNSAAADSNDSDEDDDEEEDGVHFSSGCKRPWHSSLKSSNLKFHPHVYCDGCNNHVSGHRYKCLECEDYDLCNDCESQNIHKDHVMLRIPLSMSHFPKLNIFAKGMRYMSEALRKIENRMKKQERRMHKMYDIPFPDFRNLADMTPHSKRCKRDDKEKDKKEDRKDKKDKRDKRDRKEKECSSSASAGCSAEATGSSSAKPGCPFPSGILGSLLNPQTLGNLLSPQNLNHLQQLFEHMSPVPEQLLQEVAQNLADVRLGDSAPSAPEPGPSTPPTNPFSVHTKKAPVPESDGAVASSSSATQTPVAARKETASQEPEKEKQSQGAPQAASSSPSPSAAQQEGSANASGHTSPLSGRSSRSSSEEADAEGWTVVDAHLKETSGEQVSVYPKLPSREPTPEQINAIANRPPQPLPVPIQHRDPAIQKCLSDLADMGFDVHQRMVVDLAEQYKGNVNRVLNALMY